MNSSAEPKAPRNVRGDNTREIAARIVDRVLTQSSYVAPTLSAELDRNSQLAPSDRHLITEVCYGVIRTYRGLIDCLSVHTPRGLNQKDGMVLAHLLVAAYQLLVLDKVPQFAAVDSAVSGVRKLRGPRMAGFVNALLRRLAASGVRMAVPEGILKTAPDWLKRRLEKCVGHEEMLALLGIQESSGVLSFHPPLPSVRVLHGHPVPAWLAEAEPSRFAPNGYRVPGHGDLRQLEGRFTVQEEGAQLLAWLVGARPGERVLDACAGRGNKALLLAERVGSEGHVLASDLYAQKLQVLAEDARTAGLSVETEPVDWTAGTGTVPDEFDRVLVDAPCTGVGTLRRRPEILLHLGADDPKRMAQISLAILRNAASRVLASGRVVFAVCSVLPDECEGVLAQVADLLELTPFEAPELSGLLESGASTLRLLPHRHGTDGYFVANLRKRTGA
ncbi:MAG: transcription antitermination factor NusB [Polyangiaceae bacterium]|nr:transcription antitermination factor NusB [Polyangiaceae bacterium]